MENKTGKGKIVFMVIFAVILISIFIKLDSLFSVANTLASWGWSLLSILMVCVMIRLFFAGLAVLIILPFILRSGNWRDWLPRYLRIDRKIVLLGILSFAAFSILAVVISLGLGIFEGDLSAVFAFPDIRPDPDVIGWGYFLLALVPGIWEELAFRGLVQAKLRTAFSIPMSILLSSWFFSLFHLSNLVNQAPAQAISGMIMAFFFGIGWGYMTIKARSVVPAMISHYVVDSLGSIFVNIDGTDPARATVFFLMLTLLFPIFNIILAKLVYKQQPAISSATKVAYENPTSTL